MNLLSRYPLAVMDLPETLIELLDATEVVDYSEKLLEYADDKKIAPIVIGENVPLDKIMHLLSSTPYQHFVQKGHGHFFYNIMIAAVMQQNPTAVSNNPLQTILSRGVKATQKLVIPFDCSQDKDSAMKYAQVYLERHKLTRLSEGVLQIISELISNALYHGPVDSQGIPVHTNVPRSQPVKFPENRHAQLFIGHNEQTLVVGCQDGFGSINKQKLLSRMRSVFSDEKAKIREDGGGFGLGLKTVVDNSSGFYMLIQSGRRTTVFTTFPVDAGMRKVTSMSKNIHIKFY